MPDVLQGASAAQTEITIVDSTIRLPWVTVGAPVFVYEGLPVLFGVRLGFPVGHAVTLTYDLQGGHGPYILADGMPPNSYVENGVTKQRNRNTSDNLRGERNTYALRQQCMDISEKKPSGLTPSGLKGRGAEEADFPSGTFKNAATLTFEAGQTLKYIRTLPLQDGSSDTCEPFYLAVLKIEAGSSSKQFNITTQQALSATAYIINTGTAEEEETTPEPTEPVYGGPADNDLRGDDGADEINGGKGNDTLYGGAGDDTLDGGRGADVLYGEDDNDTLLGGRGGDTLYGGPGDDIIKGGIGRDILYGGDGDDTYTGGPGDDQFVFVSGETGDKIITDFGRGDDIIVLEIDEEPSPWPSASTIVEGVETQDQYSVYTLSDGLTVETDVPLVAEDFVLD